MRQILVLTDFSGNANHAAKAALIFGEKLHADLLLMNNMAGIPMAPELTDSGNAGEELSWESEESRVRLESLKGHLEMLVSDFAAERYKPAINKLLTEGLLGENINAVNILHKLQLIVMGGETGNFFEHLLSGSHTRTVVENAPCPVLIIPEEYNFEKLKKVVFATNLDTKQVKHIKWLIDLEKLFDFNLEIVYVSLFDTGEETDEQKEIRFATQLAKLKYPKLLVRDVSGKEILPRLGRLCAETGADLLALVHYRHSFFSRLLNSSNTDYAIRHQQLPLLIFPGNA